MPVKSSGEKPSKGRLLISEPFLTDPYFRRSVVLLSEHGEEGTVGFIINKPTEVMLNEALKDFPEFSAHIYFGGPVQPDSLHYIHRLGNKLEGSREIGSGIYWGGEFEELKLLIDTRQVNPEDIRFYAGYSGWGPQQLNEELDQKSWIVARLDHISAFSEKPRDLWKEALKSLGSDYAMIANFPEDPSMN